MGSNQIRKCASDDCESPAATYREVCLRCYNKARYAANRETRKARALENHKKRSALVRNYTTTEVVKRELNKQHAHLTVRATAMMALSAARVNEARVVALMTQLGLNATVLPRDASSIIVLLEDLIQPLRYVLTVSPEYVRYWGAVFFGMDETYLEAVGVLLESDEPWRPFCDFANRLTRALHTDGAEALKRSESLGLAERYFASARGHLWNISYLLCRRLHDYKTAEKVFGGRPSAVNELYSLLCPQP